MTKKDYILIANIFKNNRKAILEAQKEKRKITIEGIISALERDFADMLYSENNRFDYRKFREYVTSL